MDYFELAKHHFFEGLRLLEAKDFKGAEFQFARSLELMPDRVSTINNLAGVKLRLKQFAEGEALARRAIALDAASPEAWSNLGTALNATKRPEEALQAYDRALQGDQMHASAWFAKATTLLELKRFDEALPACNRALQLNPGYYKALFVKSLILKKLEREEEAQEVYLRSLKMRVAASPVFTTERRATQAADILVIRHNPDVDGSLKSFEALHRECPNFPGQLAKRFPDEFHFAYVFESDACEPGSRKQIPQPDVVINNIANGEVILTKGNLPVLTALVDSFGVPVVNHPAKIVQSTRDATAGRLADIPGICVPKTMRFSSEGKTPDELVQAIENQYDYPLITRTLVFQQSKGMTKVDNREALLAVITTELPENFFVTEFVDSRGGRESYRKLRAAIVRDEIIVVRADYDSYWNVHGRKSDERVAFYMNNPHLLEEEKRICQDPEAELGQSAVQALQTMRDRISLDVFGIDFDVDGNGRLVFYETNASMNLFSTARVEVPYPQASEDKLKQAFQTYIKSLVARR